MGLDKNVTVVKEVEETIKMRRRSSCCVRREYRCVQKEDELLFKKQSGIGRSPV